MKLVKISSRYFEILDISNKFQKITLFGTTGLTYSHGIEQSRTGAVSSIAMTQLQMQYVCFICSAWEEPPWTSAKVLAWQLMGAGSIPAALSRDTLPSVIKGCLPVSVFLLCRTSVGSYNKRYVFTAFKPHKVCSYQICNVYFGWCSISSCCNDNIQLSLTYTGTSVAEHCGLKSCSQVYHAIDVKIIHSWSRRIHSLNLPNIANETRPGEHRDLGG